jgi:hypothetical protein
MGKDFSDFEQEAWGPLFIKRLCDVLERRRAVSIFFFQSYSYYLSNSVHLFHGSVSVEIQTDDGPGGFDFLLLSSVIS